jgi:hypothetical protein
MGCTTPEADEASIPVDHHIRSRRVWSPMRGWFVMVVLLVSQACASENPEQARAHQCRQLREHLVDLRLAGASVDVEAHRATITRALGDRFLSRCATDLTDAQVTCALKASDPATAMQCTRNESSH